MEQKLRELKTQVRCLLEEHHPEGININSFWGLYERKYHTLPALKLFKVRKRSEILELCNDVFRKVGSGGATVIHLKSSDHSDRQQPLMSRGADGGKSNKREVPFMMSVETGNTRPGQFTTTQAGMKEYASSSSGSFYDRFYGQSDADTGSDAKTGSVAPTGPGSYLRQIGGGVTRPAAAAALSNASPSSLFGTPPQRFAVPFTQFLRSTPTVGSPAVGQGYSTPRSRDSSGSRSSDGAPNQSPAPGGRHASPRAPGTMMTVQGVSSLPVRNPGVPIPIRGCRPSREQLNSAAEDCIDRLSVAKDYVSLEKISRLLCQDFGVSSLDELNLPQIDALPCVNEHKRLECKVNAYIQNFVKVCFL